MTTTDPQTQTTPRRRAGRRLRTLAVTGALSAGTLLAVTGAGGTAQAGKLPTHGLDKKGFCSPKYIYNTDCYHQTDTHYNSKDCKKLASQLKIAGGKAYCTILPPEGDGVITAYTPSCKQAWSIEDCRRDHGSKPYVMRPGKF